MREFKKATQGIEEDIRSAMDAEPERVTSRSTPAASAAAQVPAPADHPTEAEAPVPDPVEEHPAAK